MRIVDTEGKKVYHITPDGERFLDENKGVLDEIAERLREAVHGFTGGAMGDLNQAFARIAKQAYGRAWRAGADADRTRRIVEILRKAAEEIEAV